MAGAGTSCLWRRLLSYWLGGISFPSSLIEERDLSGTPGGITAGNLASPSGPRKQQPTDMGDDMIITLAAVVRQVESSTGKAQIRFEDGAYAAVQEGRANVYALQPIEIMDRIATANRCSPATAKMIFCTSWGEYQDMGFEIYGELCVPPDVVPSIWEWLADTGLQDRMFTKWCFTRGFHAQGPLPDDDHLAAFARAYNGPGDVTNYVSMMKAAAAALGAS